jgi:hypothetical protein
MAYTVAILFTLKLESVEYKKIIRGDTAFFHKISPLFYKYFTVEFYSSFSIS